ncbi:MAG: hypothetical protein BWY70_01182 [Bacteroidetes bacterium ADurb.Bin408]|nr:MAG: hypothetical protein BWY70_01182 [Bacteroidetes bacterium ADurb.Bin408]
MKKLLIITLMLQSGYISGQNWNLLGPADIHTNDVLFNAGSMAYTLICTDSGVCLNNGTGYS